MTLRLLPGKFTRTSELTASAFSQFLARSFCAERIRNAGGRMLIKCRNGAGIVVNQRMWEVAPIPRKSRHFCRDHRGLFLPSRR